MPIWEGESYRSDGGSPERYFSKKTGEEAPPEAYKHFARKWMRRAGIKPAGRHKKATGETAGEQCLTMLCQGLSWEEIAKARGISLDSVERNVRRAKRK